MTLRPAALLLAAALTACHPAPAHADAFPDQLPADPARPGQRSPATGAHFPMAGADYDFDPDRGPLVDAAIEDAIWLVGPGAWGASTAPIPLLPPPVVTPCRPPAAVPGPLPMLGLGAAFAYSRKLRQRIR